MPKTNTLKYTSNAELLSYIINSMNNDPSIGAPIELPKQGESIIPIGKLISSNDRYRNAFMNTINVLALTMIKRNHWDNPWKFANRGSIRNGMQIREMILDLAKVYDYNDAIVTPDTTLLATEVPNVLQYIHEVNFQKVYKCTTSTAQLQMAFERENGIFDFIIESVQMLYESLVYDTYIVDKYMLCRRALDGTITAVQIADYDTKTPRQRVSAMKNISNKMSFRSPNYNPAGIRKATSFDNQILIVNTEFEADFTTEVLATSFFKNEADMRARLVLCDDFAVHDDERLTELLGTRGYSKFTEDEIAKLKNLPAVLISEEWFMDFDYALDGESGEKETSFYNAGTLEDNHFLHAWKVFSTSPFENAAVFTSEANGVTSVTVNPPTVTASKGTVLYFTANVVTTGFANKAVKWEISQGQTYATVDAFGKVTLKDNATGTIKVKATSIFDNTKTGEGTITIA